MNLDELMAVWKSQDASPLHGVNETLLRLALRQEETQAQKQRRRERWIVYGMVIGMVTLNVAFLARFLFFMIYRQRGIVLSGWDYAGPVAGVVAGMAAALLTAGRLYLRQRAQAVREQRFGESLRDQINRQLALCDYAPARTRPASRLGIRLPVIISVAAFFAIGRIHNWTLSDARLWGLVGFFVVFCILVVKGASWEQRRFVERKILPRQRQLEALLKELDDQ